jgi:hypothetical protein
MCRERQKETISSLEAEVTEKLAQLQALSAENEMLKLRSAVLEATVKGREYHVSAAVTAATCWGCYSVDCCTVQCWAGSST